MSAVAAAAPRPRRLPRWVGRVRWYLPAILLFVGGILLWEWAVGALNITKFLLPRPSAIVTALVANWTSSRFPLFPAAVQTLKEAVLGLALGTVVGVVVAFAIARWATARSYLLPLAIAVNAIPLIAFAPLVNAWFGLLNETSKVVMAAILVFFPVMANVTRGLVQVDGGALELMRSYAAGQWTVLRKVRIPNALPYFFTAMKIATTLSLIGAVVGEYYGGQPTVLGRIIVQSASALRFDITWAAILLVAAAGIGMYLVTVLLERLVIPWHQAVSGE